MSCTHHVTEVKRATLLSTLFVIAVCLVGYSLAEAVAAQPLGQPALGWGNVFYHLYGRHERPFLVLHAVGVAGAALYLLAMRAPADDPAPDTRARAFYAWPVALAVVIVTWLGSRVILHGLPLSMDEFNAVFQSRIFASGRTAAPVPPEWHDLAPVITPTFVTYRPDDHVWLSGYLPVYAAIRTVFLKVGLEPLVNPLLGGLAALAIAAAARLLRPDDRPTAGIAVLLLATSSQFLLTTMSWYAMPAQLLLNLGWLLLWLRGGRALLLAPWAGVLALGLNNPFPHALFVAPFLLRMLTSRRHAMLAYAIAAYLAGSALWLAWWAYALPSGSSGRMAGMFGLPGGAMLATQIMNLALALSWQNLLLAPGLGVALAGWRRLSAVERDLAVGLLLTLGFYAFFERTQGHGWGYRYFYPALGNAVLLAAVGLRSVGRVAGEARLRHLVGSAALLALVFQFPWRSIQVEGFVRPWARAVSLVAESHEPVVVLPTASVWYGFDLIRNDPFLGPPVSVSGSGEKPGSPAPAELRRRVGSEAWFVTADELGDLGLHVGAPSGLRGP
jgi:hypothetical protein